MNAVCRACELVGGVGKLAVLVGVAAPTVTQWCKGGRPVPPRKAVLIERVTNRGVTRQDLYPDEFRAIWPELTAPPTTEQPATAGAA